MSPKWGGDIGASLGDMAAVETEGSPQRSHYTTIAKGNKKKVKIKIKTNKALFSEFLFTRCGPVLPQSRHRCPSPALERREGIYNFVLDIR